MVGLDVRVEDRDDLRALRRRQRDVLLHEVHVRVDDRERAVRLAPKQVRGASRLVVQQLPEEHGRLERIALIALDKLSNDLLNINRWDQSGRSSRGSTRSPRWERL